MTRVLVVHHDSDMADQEVDSELHAVSPLVGTPTGARLRAAVAEALSSVSLLPHSRPAATAGGR